MRIYNFACGIKFAFRQTNSSAAYCALSIKSGTRNEPEKYHGLAHMTEHMLFKGTSSKSAATINSYLERLGGELNAYTTKEEMVLHATVLKDDIQKAFDLLSEMTFTSIFPKKELEKEKVVILDEINSYKDSPSDLIFDEFEQLLFEGTSLSTPVLGDPKSVKSITDQVIKSYVREFFIPSNISITLVANLSDSKAVAMVKKALLKYAGVAKEELIESEINCSRESIEEFSPITLKDGKIFNIIKNRKNHQAHCIIGATSYSLYQQRRRYAMILLANILGGAAANSRLNVSLRERRGLVYSVEASFVQYSDTGVLTIYFGCDKAHLDRCIDLIHKELDFVKENELSARYLQSAKKQLLGQLAISSDNGEAQALSMGKSLLVYGDILSSEMIREHILAITAQDIRDAANEVFNRERLSQLIYR